MDGIRIIEDAAVCAVGADSLGGIPPPAEAGVRVVARVSHRAAADAADAGLTLCEDETIQSLGFTYFHASLVGCLLEVDFSENVRPGYTDISISLVY